MREEWYLAWRLYRRCRKERGYGHFDALETVACVLDPTDGILLAVDVASS